MRAGVQEPGPFSVWQGILTAFETLGKGLATSPSAAAELRLALLVQGLEALVHMVLPVVCTAWLWKVT